MKAASTARPGAGSTHGSNSSPTACGGAVETLPLAAPAVDAAMARPGQPLGTATRRRLEPHFGHDFGSVRVHLDHPAEQAAQAVQARAFTLGRSIVFGAGQYEPASRRGLHLLAHELAHVTQQAARQRAGPAAVPLQRKPQGPPVDEPADEPAPAAAEPSPAEAAPQPAAAPAALVIQGSVGRGGLNLPDDVARVQARLLELGLLSNGDLASAGGDAAAAQHSLADTVGAIDEFQGLLFTRHKPDGLIQPETERPTLKALNSLDAAGLAQLRQAKLQREQAQAAEQARQQAQAAASADAAARQAFEDSPAGAAARSDQARALRQQFGSFVPATDICVNLDEKGLGTRLSLMSPAEPRLVSTVLDQLGVGSGDEQEVAAWLLQSMPGPAIRDLDPDLAERLYRAVGDSAEGKRLREQMVRATVGDVAAPFEPIAAGVSTGQWVTDQHWTDRSDDDTKRQCFDACRMMLDNFNAANESKLAIGGKSQMLQVIAEDPAAKTLSVLPTAAQATGYVDAQLAKGVPVIAGTHYKFLGIKDAYNDATTDHFVLIVGKGVGNYTNAAGESVEAMYYRYYDPGTSSSESGTSEDNRLYFHADTSTWEGPTANKGRYDTLSQVRPFTSDFTAEMLKTFELNAARITEFEARRKAAKEAAKAHPLTAAPDAPAAPDAAPTGATP